MYNKTLRHIKQAYNKKKGGLDLDTMEIKRMINDEEKVIDIKETTLNYTLLRTLFLKDAKDDTLEYFKKNIDNKEINPYTHVLDHAVKLACANHKSMISNLRNMLDQRNKYAYILLFKILLLYKKYII
jgi:hypothetical protein